MVCDLGGFFRPQLNGCVGKHYQSGANTALPAIVLAVVAAGGSVGKVRLPLLRLLLRVDPGHGSEAELQRRAVTQAGATLHPDEVLVVDAGFGVADLLTSEVPRFVARVARNFTARRNRLPPYKGRGRCPIYGERVRPLPRKRQGKILAATPPDATAHPMDDRWADNPGSGLGQPGLGRRQARSYGVSLWSHPRPALSRTVGRGDKPARVGLGAVEAVP